MSLLLKARRHDILLVDGAMFLNPDDGELVRIEGRLSKTPSFWTKRVEIVRRFRRIAGVRMPTALESVAELRMAGKRHLPDDLRIRVDQRPNGGRAGGPGQ